MKRSPSTFNKYPPSPRTASDIKIPVLPRPVGWNWIISISFKPTPARKATAMPSPVERNGLVVRVQNTRPAPPVDNTMDLALIISTLPFFIFQIIAPPALPSFTTISNRYHSCKKCTPSLRHCSYVV